METCANRAEEGRVVSTRWKIVAFLFFFFSFLFEKLQRSNFRFHGKEGRKELMRSALFVVTKKIVLWCGVERRLNGLDRLRSGTD